MATPPGARAHPTAAFYGDSIVTGWRGTTHPRARWTSVVCDELAWRETTFAVDGMGYVRRRGPRDATGRRPPDVDDVVLLAALIRTAPDVVVVCLGANDLEVLDSHGEAIRRAGLRDLRLLTTELPGVPLVVVDYFPVADLRERAARLHEWVVASCQDVGATYVEGFRVAVNADPRLLCDDGVHPNDAGHRVLADALLPALRDIVAAL